ncbi:hypothetical protein ABZ760_31095 [Streptomyces sp. NPDC006658]|uniref:hypothetical protein n=1 Tax=Streptomyces sp. NPDC006658 TaxID=3156900 RepID=UPI0034086B06
MTDSTPEDGERTSFIEKTKDLYGRHKGKILAAGTALGGVALTAVVLAARKAMEQDATEDTGDTEDSGDTGSAADSAAEDERRKPPVRHPVTGHTRTLADGRVVPVAGYERGGSSDDEDDDDDDDESPGDAAA